MSGSPSQTQTTDDKDQKSESQPNHPGPSDNESICENTSELSVTEEESEEESEIVPKPVVHSETLASAISEIIDMLIEEETYFTTKEIGRQLRGGELDTLGVIQEVPKEYQVIEAPGLDVFGQPLLKKPNFECECPKCKRTLAAARFAPHLEKCMGMGRNSSRIASRRLAASSSGSNQNLDGSNKSSSSNSNANGDLGSDEDHFSADEDDEEWTMEKKRKTKKPDKISPKRKGPIHRLKNEGVGRGNKRSVFEPTVVPQAISVLLDPSIQIKLSSSDPSEFHPSST